MSAVIYKQGQGYWVRALSAVFFGIMVLAAAAWGWSQAGAYDPPVRGYTYRVAGVTGEVEPGHTVELLDLSLDTTEDRLVPFATGTVESVEAVSGSTINVLVRQIEVSDARYDVTGVKRLRRVGAAAGADAAFRGSVETRIADYLYPRVYLQGAVAGVVMLLGAVLIYWFVGHKRGSVDFLIATDGEMKKVNWSTRREVIGSTQVVIVAAFLIAALLFAIDTGFGSFFQAVGVLEG